PIPGISRWTRSARTRLPTTPGARRSLWSRPSAGLRPTSPTSADMESQKKHPRTFSFEFFPPKTPEGMEKLRATWKQLAQLKPRFFSCTYGAGGSTRERTLETVLEIQAAGHPAAPHISCVGASRADVAATLELYRAKGIDHVVALRGDLPSGAASAGELRHANELVAFIRECTGDHFHVEVACYPEFHPQAKSPRDDLANFKRKLEAGADS